MIKAAEKDLPDIYCGARYDLQILWVNNNMEAVDMSEYEARMTLREYTHTGTVGITIDETSGRMTNNGTEGLYIFMNAVETSSLTAMMYVYDLELVPVTPDPGLSAEQCVIRIAFGKVKARQQT